MRKKLIKGGKNILIILFLIIFSGLIYATYTPNNLPHLANSDRVPELTVYQLNNHARIEWAVEMLPEDVLIYTTFEPHELRPHFRTRNAVQHQEGINTLDASNVLNRSYVEHAHGWVDKSFFVNKNENGELVRTGNGLRSISMQLREKYTVFYMMNDGRYRLEHILFTNGMQSLTNEIAYVGEFSHKVENTNTPYRMGNSQNFHNIHDIVSVRAIASYPRILGIPNGTDLSLSIRVRSDGGGFVGAFGDGDWAKSIQVLPNVITQNVSASSRVIPLDTLSGVSAGTWMTSDLDPEKIAIARRIIMVCPIERTITLDGPIGRDIQAGENLRRRHWRGGFHFSDRLISNNNEWNLINLNTRVNDHSDYDVAVRGFTFFTNVNSRGNTFIDEIKFGYATRAQLFRGETLLYEGFLSDFNDLQATDKANPDPVTNFNFINNNGALTIEFDKPNDNGTTYEYKVRSISDSGAHSAFARQSVEIVSGIKGYSYVINKNPTTIPNNIINTTNNFINFNITEGGTYYLHIKAIDNAGNVSETTHKQINIPFLTAIPNHQENYIRLNWGMECHF